MAKKVVSIFCAGFFVLFFGGLALAQHGHDHGGGTAPATKVPAKPMAKANLQSQTIDGLKVTFEVMSMGEHMKHAASGASHGGADHGKSHSLMVTLQDAASREIISDAAVDYTIVTPGGAKEEGKLTWSGDHYAAGFDPQEKGVYKAQLKIVSGGVARDAKFETRI